LGIRKKEIKNIKIPKVAKNNIQEIMGRVELRIEKLARLKSTKIIALIPMVLNPSLCIVIF
jgi:hypothetical protein